MRDLLFNVSYRDSKREDVSNLFSSNASSTTGSGEEATQKIAIAEGSWVIGSRSVATAKYTRFENQSLSKPDFLSAAQASSTLGPRLDVNDLITQGRLTLPTTGSGNAAFNAFLPPFLDKHGYANASAVPTAFRRSVDLRERCEDSLLIPLLNSNAGIGNGQSNPRPAIANGPAPNRPPTFSLDRSSATSDVCKIQASHCSLVLATSYQLPEYFTRTIFSYQPSEFSCWLPVSCYQLPIPEYFRSLLTTQ